MRAVPAGLIGLVVSRTPGPAPSISSVSNVTERACAVWLETIRTIGPAPKRRGDTATRVLVIAALTLIGDGGRSPLGWPSSPPQPPAAIAATSAAAACGSLARISDRDAP